RKDLAVFRREAAQAETSNSAAGGGLTEADRAGIEAGVGGETPPGQHTQEKGPRNARIITKKTR
ncbi:hypothetical protein, partial [Treponema sp. R6D11]